jgi:hypothetical protein
MEASHDPRRPHRLGLGLPPTGIGEWRFTLYPEAAEGGGAFRSGMQTAVAGPEGSPRDAAQAVALRRARGKLRRYCAANRLNRLGTLTYAGTGCHDPAALRSDVGGFFRELRRSLGEPFPYLWVPEWHPRGHGLHLHFAVGRFVRQRLIRDTWGRGHVHIKLLGNLPIGSGTRGEARLAARYLSKYVGKDLGAEGQPSGLHRYEVAQGFQPRGVVLDGASADAVLAWCESYMGAPPERVWRSRDQIDWAGPPAVWASWR